MLTEVASGIFAADHRVAEGKNAVIIGTRAALAIDTGSDPEEGQALADLIRTQGRVPDRLLYTHGHGDHIFGSSAFLDAEVFAAVGTPAVMRRQRWPGSDRPPPVAWPTVTFAGDLYLDLGGKTVHVFPTPGHSPDGVAAFVMEDRVLVAGDTVVTGIVPAVGDGDARQLEVSLRALAELEIETLIAGHGPVLHGRERVREWITWLADYLQAVRQRVRLALTDGASLDEAADAVAFTTVIGDRLPADQHGMPRRHWQTVRKVTQEEQDRRGGG